MKFKNFIKQSLLKPLDIAIICMLILLSFVPIVIFSVQKSTSDQVAKEAVLRVEGQEIRTFELKADQETYTYKYEDSDGDYNIIEVSGEKIRISKANCGDQVCVRRGWATNNGETIVCLPHKLVIEVRAIDGSGGDSLIY